MDETALIRKAQDGNRAAFETLLLAQYEGMFRMAFKWCGNRADAEDITQEACLKLARNIGAFKFRSAFSSWLYRLVINTGKDMMRTRKEQATNEAPEIAVNDSADDKLYAREVLAQLYALPENEKTALLLVLDEGLTHREAAVIMGCKESTVSWYIHEARKKLSALLPDPPPLAGEGMGGGKKERRHG